jgi:hypothetical protein
MAATRVRLVSHHSADQRTLILAAIWLVGQCTVFIRNREQLAAVPALLSFDDAAVERLAVLISGWALAWLANVRGPRSRAKE